MWLGIRASHLPHSLARLSLEPVSKPPTLYLGLHIICCHGNYCDLHTLEKFRLMDHILLWILLSFSVYDIEPGGAGSAFRREAQIQMQAGGLFLGGVAEGKTAPPGVGPTETFCTRGSRWESQFESLLPLHGQRGARGPLQGRGPRARCTSR